MLLVCDMCDPEAIDYMAADATQDHERDYAEKAYELMRAGWRFEIPGDYADLSPMSWYWRRPPRRKNSKGMLYRSTDQALNALRREQA